MGMGIENPFDREVPLAHEGKQGVGRRRGRRSRLFVIVEHRINKRATSGAGIRDHILHAATARVEKAVNLGLADKMAGDQWRLDVAAHASLSSAPVSFNSSFVDRAGPVFEAAEIVDIVVTHIFEQLTSKGRSTARDAIQDYGFSLFKIFVVIGRFRIGAEFQHAA